MRRAIRREVSFLAFIAAIFLLIRGERRWGTLLGVLASSLLFFSIPKVSFERKSVVITGGSRGLGLALAEQFLKEGALVTILARDHDELQQAELILKAASHQSGILVIACDVTQPLAFEDALIQVEKRFEKIDILINNAGTISVGPFEVMEQLDFSALLDLQVTAVVEATQLVLPYFKRKGKGHIVNIASIGGKIPVPHMSSYCASKFALSGLSETIAAELAVYNVKVTTVYPGLMQTGSPIQAVFKGDHEKEFAWFNLGDVFPVLSISAEKAASIILDGVRNGDAQIVFPFISKIGNIVHTLFPELFSWILSKAALFFPVGTSKTRKTGAQCRGWLEKQVWYWPFKNTAKHAEIQLNQTEKLDANFNLGILQ